MENDRILIAALVFIALIVGSNLVMYAVVRGMTKGGETRWMETLRKSFSKPAESSANKSMDELRKRVEELDAKRKKE